MSRRNRRRPTFTAARAPITNHATLALPSIAARSRARDAMAGEDHKPWFRIANYGSNATSTAEVYLYSDIGMRGTTADEFVKELNAVKGNVIDLRINSRGGEVFDGITIFNALRNHAATVNVTVDGLAASAASFIAQAGDTITMDRGSQMMIHDAQTVAMGNANDMRETADLLDKASNTIASIYAERAGGTVESWRTTMGKDAWYTAEEAVEAGLADACVPARTKGAPSDREDSGTGKALASQALTAVIGEAIPEGVPESSRSLDDVLDDAFAILEADAVAPIEPAPIAFDSNSFRASVRAGTAPPPAALTPDMFRAALTLGVRDIGAPVLAAKPTQPVDEPMRVDPDLFRRALREAKL